MTSRYSARIDVAAGDRAGAVLAAVGADARFYPDGGGASTRVSAGAGAGGGAQPAAVRVEIDAGQLPHLRAGINSALRLVQASYESIGAAAPAPARPQPAATAAAAPPSRSGPGPAPAGGRQRREPRRGPAR